MCALGRSLSNHLNGAVGRRCASSGCNFDGRIEDSSPDDMVLAETTDIP